MLTKDFGPMSRSEIVKYTHTLPEWEDPNGSSIEIKLDVLAAAAGHSYDDAKRIVNDLAAIQLLESFSGNAPK
jgi:hypothetical protein